MKARKRSITPRARPAIFALRQVFYHSYHCTIKEHYGNSLTTQLNRILAGSNVHLGVSYPFHNLMHLPQFLEQAKIALDNAQDRGIPVSYCSDCAISYLKSVIQRDQHTNMEHPVLLQIKRYDEKHSTSFFETLKTYMIEERSIQRTAAALNIHKNTLLYRIRRLQELFPIDLDDSDERLRILLSLMLY